MNNCNVDIDIRPIDWTIKQYLVACSMKTDPKIVGSFKYTNFIYFKDIDAMELIDLGNHNSRKLAVELFQIQLLSVIRRILLKQDMTFVELKCGVDPNFQTIIEITKNVSLKNTKIIDELKKINKFINDDDKNIIQKKSVEDIHELIRKRYYTLRWNLKELLNGKKKISNGRTITLYQALNDYPSMVKIDLIVPIKGTFKDLSVIYTAFYHHNNDIFFITDKIQKDYFPNGSINQIKYYIKQNDILKYLKRLFMLCKWLLDSTEYKKHHHQACAFLKIINRIIVEESPRLDRIADEAIVLKKLITIVSQYNDEKIRMDFYHSIVFELLGFNARIMDSINSNRNQLKESLTLLLKTINQNLFDKVILINANGIFGFRKNEKYFINQIQQTLDQIIAGLTPVIEKFSKQSLKKHNLDNRDILEFIESI